MNTNKIISRFTISSILMFAIIWVVACSSLYFNRSIYKNGEKTEKAVVFKTRILQNEKGMLEIYQIGKYEYNIEQGTLDKNITEIGTSAEKNKDAIITAINPAYALTLKDIETTATEINENETEY